MLFTCFFSSPNFHVHGHRRLGAAKLRAYDYGERNGYMRGTIKEIAHNAEERV